MFENERLRMKILKNASRYGKVAVFIPDLLFLLDSIQLYENRGPGINVYAKLYDSLALVKI